MAEIVGRPDEIPLVAIVGPTGAGKTALAVALARAWPIEAVSVDSRQVYRRMDIGTGKPTPDERRLLRHHLLDLVEPDEPYDAARFARDAAAAIADIHARGPRPVLVGGTGLYLKALLHGLSPLPPADLELRRRLRADAATEGRAALHRRLEELDPETAARLHPRDLMRVTRALEIALVTGRPASASRGRGRPATASPYRVLTIGLTMARRDLYARLEARVDRMLAEGLLREVEGLLAAGFGPDLPAMQGIGYRHLTPVLTRGASLDEAVSAMKRDTRRYAKRQWTWFARVQVAHWVTVEADDVAGATGQVKRMIETAGIFG
ncbi:MAG TPA: tRNA (adenosine(37)-N6)-dimethylallyltransferase MiaA [Methylomirabilota bacterium]|nr:tRNA (adenosine(37)-N6)-dimethylallyltransferase MiaA [Methylomirabilota bacterium]